MTTATTDTTIGERLAADLRLLADMAENAPLIAKELCGQFYRFLVPVGSADDPRAAMATFLRAAMAVGATTSKSYDEEWGSVDLRFPNGELSLHVYASRELVCTKRVLGVREVTEEVPDPDALAAVPKVKVTRTVEDVEWDCMPLLAEATA